MVTISPSLDELRHELAEKSRQLSELELMLADYETERKQLIRDLRRLQTLLRAAEELKHQRFTDNHLS